MFIKALNKLSIVALFVLGFAQAGAAYEAKPIYDIEGAFKTPPASFLAAEAAKKSAPVAEEVVVKEDVVVAETPKAAATGCGLEVVAISSAAVGDPCATTKDVMNQLGLTAAQQKRVSRLERTMEAHH